MLNLALFSVLAVVGFLASTDFALAQRGGAALLIAN